MKEAEKSFRRSLKERKAKDRSRHARATFTDLDKEKLRAALYLEQKSICVYCQVRISEEQVSLPRVEHWRPLHDERSQEDALNWKNLYLSCCHKGSCDQRKGGQRLVWNDEDDDLPWPCEARYHDWLGYSRDGTVYVRKGAPLTDAQRKALEWALNDTDGRKSILNLNHRSLVASRREAIRTENEILRRRFKNRTASPEQRLESARELLSRDKYPEFVSVRIACLTRQLGKDR